MWASNIGDLRNVQPGKVSLAQFSVHERDSAYILLSRKSVLEDKEWTFEQHAVEVLEAQSFV